MQRFVLLSCIVYGLLFAGLVTLRGEYLALSIPFAVYLIGSAWSAPAEPALRIERRLSDDRAEPGRDVRVTLSIRNSGRTIEELSIEDVLAAPLALRSGSARHLMRLAAGEDRSISYTVVGPRGAHAFEGVWVVAGDPLGLFRTRRFLPVAGQLYVFPQVRRLKPVSIRPRRTRVYAGAIPARAGGSGTEFFGVRDYRPGDSPRSINWRASARHPGSLYSNEFQQERVADVGIVLDARLRSNLYHGGASIFEHSIRAAASLAHAFILQGDRVGMLIYGSYLSWTLPGYGKVQKERILRSLAEARVGGSTVFAGLQHLSGRMFPPESQIVLVSSLVQDDQEVLIQLRARGYQVLVICPDPVPFEKGLLAPKAEVDQAARIVQLERRVMLRGLERAGIQIVEWDVTRPVDQALNPALMRLHSPARRRLP